MEISKKTFKTIAYYDPHLPDRSIVYQWSGIEFQRLANQVFRGAMPHYSGVFTSQVLQWLFEQEWYIHYFTKEDLLAMAPPFLKTFLDRYSFKGFKTFVSSIRMLYGVEKEIIDQLRYLDEPFEENILMWRQLKVDSYLLLNLKRGLGIHKENDGLVVVAPPLFDWRYDRYSNGWGLFPTRNLLPIDRSLMLTFESNVCIYRGNNRRAVHRSVAAYHLKKAFQRMIARQFRIDHWARETAELTVQYVQTRRQAIDRLSHNMARFDRAFIQAGGLMTYLQQQPPRDNGPRQCPPF